MAVLANVDRPLEGHVERVLRTASVSRATRAGSQRTMRPSWRRL